MGDKVEMKGCKRQSCCEIHIEQSSEGCCAYNIAGHEAEDGRRILRFLYDLGTKGGCVVASSECSTIEIAQAQACRRMFVASGGLGYVRRTRPDVAALQTALQEVEAERDEWKAQLDLGWQKSVEKSIAQVWEQKERAEEAERKLELLQPQWSDDAPTEPGWYWFVSEYDARALIVEVIEGDDYKLRAFAGWLDGQTCVEFGNMQGQWSGPITPPQTGDER